MEDNNYSVTKSAKKSFGTFMLTLSISLIVFSAIYYFMTKSSLDSDDFDISLNSKEEVTSNYNVQKEEEESGTVFGQIASKDPNTAPKEVLAGATQAVTQQTTQSSASLNTGVTSITFGLISALAIFIFTIIFVYRNPRNIALSSFERNSTKGL